MKKSLKFICFVLVLGINLIILASFLSKSRKNNVAVSSSSVQEFSNLSNKKVCWGLKREKNHKQPVLAKENLELINNTKSYAIGSNDKKNIYLTFDAGYEAGYTEKILEVLKANNVIATFFITGHYFNSEPELVKKMIENKNIIGNHTVNHKSLPDCELEKIKNEVMNLHTVVYEKFGYEMKYVRPPKGEISLRVAKYLESLGYTNVVWSLAYDDWDESKQGRTEYAKKKILENLHNGAIILLHTNSKDNAEILEDVIKSARDMGYEFKSLDEFEK